MAHSTAACIGSHMRPHSIGGPACSTTRSGSSSASQAGRQSTSPRLAPDQPGQRLAVGAVDRLGALGQPVEHGDQSRIAARRWRPRQLDHRHAEPGQLLGEGDRARR